MKDIQELLQTVDKYKDTIIQQRFPSKKNTVAYVTYQGKPRVFKWFAPGYKKNMSTEYHILQQATSNTLMPTVFEKDDKNYLLIMNFITGDNLCDVINDKNKPTSEKQHSMKQLAQWFAKFHQQYKSGDTWIIRGDSNIRNFIVSNQLWSIDFEESRAGKPVEDIAVSCASILSTNPMFTSEKFQLCALVIQHYNMLAPGRIHDIKKETAYALLQQIPWRPQDDEILRAQANSLIKKGFTSV